MTAELSRIPSERQLAEMLGVNRPTVRDAIKSLGFLGLLEIRGSSGTYFRGPDSDVLYRLSELGLVLGERGSADLLRARAELETLVAGLATDHQDHRVRPVGQHRQDDGDRQLGHPHHYQHLRQRGPHQDRRRHRRSWYLGARHRQR
ncbi:GntR family transcriptional regulator [Streptomyces sp. NPDC048277]|uniref:FadR/GntR family transcriptional regulator n=1 Tax=Streptomyces sp. NPDC048277 TaxID=3155027 RepID=UPI0033F5A718